MKEKLLLRYQSVEFRNAKIIQSFLNTLNSNTLKDT